MFKMKIDLLFYVLISSALSLTCEVNAQNVNDWEIPMLIASIRKSFMLRPADFYKENYSTENWDNIKWFPEICCIKKNSENQALLTFDTLIRNNCPPSFTLRRNSFTASISKIAVYENTTASDWLPGFPFF